MLSFLYSRYSYSTVESASLSVVVVGRTLNQSGIPSQTYVKLEVTTFDFAYRIDRRISSLSITSISSSKLFRGGRKKSPSSLHFSFSSLREKPLLSVQSAFLPFSQGYPQSRPETEVIYDQATSHDVFIGERFDSIRCQRPWAYRSVGM